MEEFNIITQNGIYYLLNEESKTAIVVNRLLKQEDYTDLTDNLEDLYIPHQITHGKVLMLFPKKYTVTSIGDHAFYSTKISINLKRVFIPPKLIKICDSASEDCESLCEVIISDDSELQVIEKNAFKNALVENLSFPKTICDIKNAFTKAFCLKTIEIHPENKHYAKYNDFIIGKSDIKSEVFDTLIFSRRDIINATIPSFIKVIGSCAFHLCSELRRIEIQNFTSLKITHFIVLNYKASLFQRASLNSKKSVSILLNT